MKNVSILIISNEHETGKLISDKIKLLRECDVIKIVEYNEAISVLNSITPNLILVHSSNSGSLGIVKKIREMKTFDKVPVIFIMNSFDEEMLISAFDNGVDDFFFITDDDSIILMRIFLTLQKSVLYNQIDICNEILISAGIREKQTGIYKKEKANVVLRNFFSKSIEENLENTVFLYIKPMAIDNRKINISKIAEIIKKVPRANDIIAYGKNSGFYIILYNAGEIGAKSVVSRVKNVLYDICKIYAAAAEITASFEEMESILVESVKEQISAETEFNYLHNLMFKEACEAIDIKDETGKKFKDFKKEFYDSFEQIAAPVFYQLQAVNTEIFQNAEINFSITEDISTFYIEQDSYTSMIEITYPAYIKLIIDVKHYEPNKEEPVVKRITFDFEDFSAEKLTLIIKNMINEFAERINTNTKKRPE